MAIEVCIVLLRAYAVFQSKFQGDLGGSELQMYLLSRELAKDPEFEVTCVARDYGQPQTEVIEGVRHRKIFQGAKTLGKVKPLRELLSVWGLYSALKELDADIYLQTCAGVETGVTAFYSKRHKKRFVYRFASDRDVDDRLEESEPLHVTRSFLYGLRRADLITCQNEYQQTRLREQWNLRSVILPALVSFESTNYQRPQGNTILWVGRGVPSKQPELFYDLARQFPEQPFLAVLSAGLDPIYYDKMLAQAKGIPNLKCLTYVPVHEIDAYFARARLLVNTSTYEGFPNTFLQAMKHGVPILSLSVNPDQLLTREQIGWVADGDPARLSEQLRTLLRDEATYLSMSRKAFEYVLQHHDSRKVVEAYKALFRKLVAG